MAYITQALTAMATISGPVPARAAQLDSPHRTGRPRARTMVGQAISGE